MATQKGGPGKGDLGAVARSVKHRTDNPRESLAQDPSDGVSEGKSQYEQIGCLFMFILTFVLDLVGNLGVPATTGLLLPLAFHLRKETSARGQAPTPSTSLLHYRSLTTGAGAISTRCL